MDMTKTIERWLELKRIESEAVVERRLLEDEMASQYGLAADAEGTKTYDEGEYLVKVVSRLDRKVDTEILHDIAMEEGLEAELDTLFRWKAELNMKPYKAASERVQEAFSRAITTKAGRHSFSITNTTEE